MGSCSFLEGSNKSLMYDSISVYVWYYLPYKCNEIIKFKMIINDYEVEVKIYDTFSQ